MRRINHRFPTVSIKPQQNTPNVFCTPSYSKQNMAIWSTSKRDLFWRNAIGMATTMPGTLNSHVKEGVFIRIEYIFGRDAVVHPEGLLDEVPISDPNKGSLREDICAVLGQIYTPKHSKDKQGNVINYLPIQNHQYARFEYELFVSETEILENDGIIYISDLDLIIGVNEHLNKVPHPYDVTGRAERLLDLDQKENEVVTAYYFVDNKRQHGTVWIHDGVAPRELKPVRDPSMPDGVHRTISSGGLSKSRNKSVHFTEVTPEYGFYPTRGQAEALGRPDEVLKRKDRERYLQLERENHELKISHEQRKREWEEADRVYKEEARLRELEVKERDEAAKAKEREYLERVRKMKERDEEKDRVHKERMRRMEAEAREREQQHREWVRLKDAELKHVQMELDAKGRKWRTIGELLKRVEVIVGSVIVVAGIVTTVYRKLHRE